MTLPEKFDRVITGLASGVIFPLLVGSVIFLFSSGGMSLATYLSRIAESDIITHSITLCVFPNIFIFLIFNRLDMLRAARGMLAITIVWAAIVFAVKFFA
jgi:hypothetical protein